jgi:hypothetical protein
MLPPFIIEQIRKREEESKRGYEQPQLEIPRDMPRPKPQIEREEDGERGTIIIQL